MEDELKNSSRLGFATIQFFFPSLLLSGSGLRVFLFFCKGYPSGISLSDLFDDRSRGLSIFSLRIVRRLLFGVFRFLFVSILKKTQMSFVIIFMYTLKEFCIEFLNF